RFLKLMGASILAGALSQFVLYLLFAGTYSVPVTGGSGMVMTALAVQAAVYPDRILSLILFRCRLINFFLALLLLDILGFLYSIAGQGGGIATHVHLAGAAVGWWWAGGHQHAPKWWVSWRSGRAQKKREQHHQRNRNEDLELDRILAKISEQGLPSLTDQERSFLEERSRKRG
ncbi:MAG: rhomboid family intramembrane serine protease, partial [Planctomycetota bacterium]|nr:rhomboid family intramembrane serine protease [Planctomycetota bacterium]